MSASGLTVTSCGAAYDDAAARGCRPDDEAAPTATSPAAECAYIPTCTNASPLSARALENDTTVDARAGGTAGATPVSAAISDDRAQVDTDVAAGSDEKAAA